MQLSSWAYWKCLDQTVFKLVSIKTIGILFLILYCNSSKMSSQVNNPRDRTIQLISFWFLNTNKTIKPFDFWPIRLSLCNVIYKIITKVISNRLSSILPSILFNNQAGFVMGWSITYNVMIGFDIMHHIYSKTNLNMTFKLDMAKAFNKVN